MSKSKFVCAEDGLAVHWFGGRNGAAWKHSSGGAVKVRSCGREPVVMTRVAYDRWLAKQRGRAAATDPRVVVPSCR
ncbi:hypothetical protein [Nocardia transvalensis]|uniref:hypothetical protein n=1 Tax=Nocardia transvalensis TaxID=37333 RepID=UPI001892DBD9|nr:hypothetical protein [Nocardia transvalensis]MBF6333466.1 hypothetical protein [Nocardia transvalensis]